MGEITEKKVMGWYGKCPECVDLLLADLDDTRYVIDEIQKIGNRGTQWSQPWQPGTKEDESGMAADGKTQMTPKLYDENHNPLFTKLECGNAYFVLHTSGTGYEIPDFVPDSNLENQLVVDECCGDKVVELEVFCKCEGADCDLMDASSCEGWDGGELLDACERLRVASDEEETLWTEPLKLWYDPAVQNFLGIGTQFYATEATATVKELPVMTTLAGKYIHVKQGDDDVFLQIDVTGKVTDTVECGSNKTISIKTCKHADYGWILMASEGSDLFKPLYTDPEDLSLELMPGSEPIDVVDVPDGWTVQKTGDYIDELEFATAITDIWGSENGGTRYLKIKVPGGDYEVAYYHSADGNSFCENPNVSDTSKGTLTTKTLFCFDGSLNDGTKECELPSTNCCGGFSYVHTFAMDIDEWPESRFPFTIGETTYSKEEFYDKFLDDASPDYQGAQWMGWMELYTSRSDFHPNNMEFNIKSMCHDDISLQGGGSMNQITVWTMQDFQIGGPSAQVQTIQVGHGTLGFTLKNEGEVVITLENGTCYHACIHELGSDETLLFVPLDEDISC